MKTKQPSERIRRNGEGEIMSALTDQMKIACCKTCLLADIMKTCATCPFNIGLKVSPAPAEVWKRAMIVKSELFAQNKGV